MWFLPDITKKILTEEEKIDKLWKETFEFNVRQFECMGPSLLNSMLYGI